MSQEEMILERILSAGFSGIRKSELKKEFANSDVNIENLLENFSSTGKIFIEKKGTSYNCWSAGGYTEHLRNSDSKFRLLLKGISNLEEKLESRIVALEQSTKLSNRDQEKHGILDSPLYDSPTYIDSFKSEFDGILGRSRDSLGWIELADVRNELGNKHNMSAIKFYELVKQLTNTYQDDYELSTGGSEGIMVRGLLHGYVRGI
jgi:hypothetical protein